MTCAPQAHAQAPGAETSMLLARIQQLRSDVVAAEQKIADFLSANPDFTTRSALDRQVSLALVQLASADDEEARRAARLASLEKLSETGITNETIHATGDGNLIELLRERDGLLQERAELAKTFKPAHPTMRELQSRINLANSALKSAVAAGLEALSAEEEAQAAYRQQLQQRLTELQETTTRASAGNDALAGLQRDAATAQLRLEIYVAQYMAPVTSPAAAEGPPITITPPVPEQRVPDNGLQSLIFPIGVAGVAVIAFLLQGVIVRRRSYRRGFDDGVRQAAADEDLIAEWKSDDAAETFDAPGTTRNVA